MQLKSLILPLFASAAVAIPTPDNHATSLNTRSADGCFKISQFRNSGSPHSISATVYFLLSDPATSLNAYCQAIMSITPSIVQAQFPTRCNDTSLAFGVEVRPGAPGYWLTIAHWYNNNQTIDAGAVWLGNDRRRFDNPSGNPNGDYDYLNYPAEFDVAYNRHIQELPPA